jgi:hypothetical protein
VANADFYIKQSTAKKNPAITQYGKSFLLNGDLMNETEMYSQLYQMNNLSINAEIKEAERSKSRQYIGFSAIPFGVIGLAIFSIGDDQPDLAGLMMGLGAISIGTAVFSKHNRNMHNKQIIKLYNQLN